MSKLGDFLAACLLMTATSAFADELRAVTPSGAAEMLFPMKPQALVGELSSKCIDNRWTVTSSSASELVCEAPLSTGQSIVGQMLLGNSYSTPPRRFFRFSIVDVNGVSRVQASGWMELQMAFGQMKRNDFVGPEFQNSVMQFLAAAGGKYPVGTTFPNHVMLGFDASDVPQGKYIGLRIDKIEPDAPAEKAGLQVGDVVNRIGSKRFKNLGDYLDATAKAADTPTYEVEIVRSGKPVTLKFNRAFRPTYAEAVVAQSPSGKSCWAGEAAYEEHDGGGIEESSG